MEPTGLFFDEEVKFFPDKYVTRKKWDADYPREKNFDFNFAEEIILTFTDSDPCQTTDECKQALREIQKRDQDAGLPDIKYNFIIGGDGYTYEGRNWLDNPELPEKHKGMKGFVLSVAYVGRPGDKPNEDQEKAYQELLEVGRENYLIVKKPVFHSYLENVK